MIKYCPVKGKANISDGTETKKHKQCKIHFVSMDGDCKALCEDMSG